MKAGFCSATSASSPVILKNHAVPSLPRNGCEDARLVARAGILAGLLVKLRGLVVNFDRLRQLGQLVLGDAFQADLARASG